MAIAVDEFRSSGYLYLPGLFAPQECARLVDAIGSNTEPDEPNELSSGAMRFFSNVYRRSPIVRSLLVDPRILGLVGAILGPDAWCRWDQAVCKDPGAGAFPWHQDNGYTALPDEHLQIWVALTDAPPERGGLWVEPGAHRQAREHRWVGSHVEVVTPPREAVPIHARLGDVVAFSSFLPHSTGPNTTEDPRWVYVAEFLPSDVDDPTIPAPRATVLRAGLAVSADDATQGRGPAPDVPR